MIKEGTRIKINEKTFATIYSGQMGVVTKTSKGYILEVQFSDGLTDGPFGLDEFIILDLDIFTELGD